MVQDLATQQLLETNIPFFWFHPLLVLALTLDTQHQQLVEYLTASHIKAVFSPFRLCPRSIEIPFLVTLIPDIPFPQNRILFLLLLLI